MRNKPVKPKHKYQCALTEPVIAALKIPEDLDRVLNAAETYKEDAVDGFCTINGVSLSFERDREYGTILLRTTEESRMLWTE